MMQREGGGEGEGEGGGDWEGEGVLKGQGMGGQVSVGAEMEGGE